ncbi:MAG: phasin family protein [Pseudomonadota bacterium]
MAAKKAAQKVDTLVEEAQKNAAASFEKLNSSLEDVAELAQGNYEAMVKASEIAAKAAEDMNAEIVAYAKKSMEEGVAAAKELSEIKTVPEFMERQTAIAKDVFEGFVAEATKISEMSSAAMQDVYAPITKRTEAAMDFAKTLSA